MQLRLNFVIFLLWWIPTVIGVIIPRGNSPCLSGGTIRAERLLAYIGVVALSLLTNAPYIPADGKRTLEPEVDAFAWTDASRTEKRAAQEKMMHAADVHVLPGLRAAPPVFSMEAALKAFAWSCIVYGFGDSDTYDGSLVFQQVRAANAEQVAYLSPSSASPFRGLFLVIELSGASLHVLASVDLPCFLDLALQFPFGCALRHGHLAIGTTYVVAGALLHHTQTMSISEVASQEL